MTKLKEKELEGGRDGEIVWLTETEILIDATTAITTITVNASGTGHADTKCRTNWMKNRSG
jgi:hypothetical protein